jgi:Plasmid encoded RepA protein
MTTLDVTSIRDPDLLAELEAARAQGTHEFKISALRLIQHQRDKLAGLPRDARRRAVTRDQLAQSVPERRDLRHLHSVIALVGLPYKRLPGTQRDYIRSQGNMGLSITSGPLLDDTGTPHIQPIPFGPKARLVLMHLCSEAIRQKSPTIEIADSFTGFVRDMGYPNTGGARGPLTAFKEQLNALAACTMRLTVWESDRIRMKTISPIEAMDLWLPAHPEQRSLWPSTVTFSPAMYESLSRHALPINTHVVRAFAGSARKLDLYFWLSWRIYSLDKPVTLSWRALYDQFGGSNTSHRDFKRHIHDDISQIKDVLAKLPIALADKGLTISPAGPEVLALPAKKIAAKLR